MSRKSFKIILWITFLTGTVIFAFFTPEKTIETYLLNILIAGVYSVTIALGNGMVNSYLSRHFSWVEQTKTRAILGIVATILVNFILVLFCNYINLIVIQKREFTGFFTGNMVFFNLLGINMSVVIYTYVQATDI